SSKEHGPSKDWLKSAKTSEARNKIRQWFKKEKRAENIQTGRDDFDREVRRITTRLTNEQYQTVLNDTFRRSHFTNAEDFFAAIGYGGISLSKLLPKLREDCQRCMGPEPEPERPAAVQAAPVKERTRSGGVIIDGFDNCLVKFAKCCNPVPGDDIIGFITRGGGVAVHRCNCSNVAASRDKQPERWLNASWSRKEGELYTAALSVVTNAGVNLFTQLSQLLSSENVFIEGIQMVPRNDKNGEYAVTVRVSSSTQLRAIITKLTTMSEVVFVKRL
ncbi:MAG: bifunctional (p)ppGpp synthetase/guanosine-3',5'-bis(diphosphate) 3'-pyrophosphohydrolase, partial [Clostridia bacterium]|nr:bifunctional (p)ppGpp synthetase/guanosine-3',5'-bis(diphosphate) 3'-pyrophosphohydrolase [Clostridia bacterium]